MIHWSDLLTMNEVEDELIENVWLCESWLVTGSVNGRKHEVGILSQNLIVAADLILDKVLSPGLLDGEVELVDPLAGAVGRHCEICVA